MDGNPSLDEDRFLIEMRADGLLIVRVRSRQDTDHPLPDAVFSFRPGDPQYRQWEQRLARQTSAQGAE